MPPETNPIPRRRALLALSAVSALPAPQARAQGAAPNAGAPLPPASALGDWQVSVTPQVFGFAVEGGRLLLRMGGVASSGPAVPLVAAADGRWRIAAGHPNAFEFRGGGTELRFFLWAGEQSFEGRRVGPPAASPAASAAPAAAAAPMRLRREQTAELPALRNAAAAGAAPAQLALAQSLFELGEFDSAHALAEGLAAAEDAADTAIALFARSSMMRGQDSAAVAQWQSLAQRHAGQAARQVPAWVGLLFAHYQQDRFDAVAALPFPPGAVLPLREQARAFAAPPYRAEWPSGAAGLRQTRVPFLATDPLPLLPAQVNGRTVNLLIDTGADQLILDDELALTLGLKELARASGEFAGGQRAPVGFARLDSLALGGVQWLGVPVQTLNTRRFAFAAGLPVGGILGTSLLRQTLATLDYAGAGLVLRERSPAARQALQQATPAAAEIPFVLDATHLMFARGSLDDQGPHTLFVDTGLAADEALVVPAPTLRDLGMAPPPLAASMPGRGGGPAAVPRASLGLRSVSLGPLRMERPQALLGPLPDSSYRARGFIQDGLLSHRFFRRYRSLSIDFEARRLRIDP